MSLIPAKVTESSTLVKCLRYFQRLAEQVNLTHVNIVEDMVWNYPEEYGNVIIYPLDFHVMRENVQVNMDSYVFSFISFLFNIACCSKR